MDGIHHGDPHGLQVGLCRHDSSLLAPWVFGRCYLRLHPSQTPAEVPPSKTVVAYDNIRSITGRKRRCLVMVFPRIYGTRATLYTEHDTRVAKAPLRNGHRPRRTAPSCTAAWEEGEHDVRHDPHAGGHDLGSKYSRPRLLSDAD